MIKWQNLLFSVLKCITHNGSDRETDLLILNALFVCTCVHVCACACFLSCSVESSDHEVIKLFHAELS